MFREPFRVWPCIYVIISVLPSKLWPACTIFLNWWQGAVFFICIEMRIRIQLFRSMMIQMQGRYRSGQIQMQGSRVDLYLDPDPCVFATLDWKKFDIFFHNFYQVFFIFWVQWECRFGSRPRWSLTKRIYTDPYGSGSGSSRPKLIEIHVDQDPKHCLQPIELCHHKAFLLAARDLV